MPAPFPPTDGVILTMGIQCVRDRFTATIPYVCTNTLAPLSAYADFNTWVGATLIPRWRNVLATDCFIRGWELRGMFKSSLIPRRVVFQSSFAPGLQGGDSDPQNTSMYGVFYSKDRKSVV